MRIASVIIALLLSSAWAQEKEGFGALYTTVQPPPPVSKVIEVKYLSGESLGQLSDILKAFPATVKVNPALRMIAASGSKETVAAIEETVLRLDVPPPAQNNIELTVYMLQASLQAVAGAKTPPELDGVVKQLKSAFAYEGYRLLDSFLLRMRNGQQGRMSGGTKDASYSFWTRNAIASRTGTRWNIRLDEVLFTMPKGGEVMFGGPKGDATFGGFKNLEIRTDVDFREGQKVVVGKSTLPDGQGALILVLSAQVFE